LLIRPDMMPLLPPADTMRRIGDVRGLSAGRRNPSAWETVRGQADGRRRIVSAVRAAGLTWTFFRREAMSVGGGDLKGTEGAGGESELSSDSATS
jgi:hypothetical protein